MNQADLEVTPGQLWGLFGMPHSESIPLKTCSKCKLLKPVYAFYDNESKTKGVQSYCKACFNSYTTQRFARRKKVAILYKGGACERCRLQLSETNSAVFDFHHKDPDSKTASFSTIRRWSWQRARVELDKTILLCANCHRTVHHEWDGVQVTDEEPLEW